MNLHVQGEAKSNKHMVQLDMMQLTEVGRYNSFHGTKHSCISLFVSLYGLN